MSDTRARTSSGPDPVTPDPDLEALLSDYRSTREAVERSVLPLATSVDGRHFEVQSSLRDLALRRGGYVVLEDEGGGRLGQVTDLRSVSTTAHGAIGRAGDVVVRLAEGTGIVLDDDDTPFHDAMVRPASPDEVAAWLGRARPPRAPLHIGELRHAPGVRATLDSGGLNRHTFMCGQSGSGKTYSLGLLIEQILSETSLRVVVLDPNSDYVGIGRVREGTPTEAAERYAHVPAEVAVWSNRPGADHPLRLTAADLDPAVQAAVLGLDPVRDREEYAALSDLLRTGARGEALRRGLDDVVRSGSAGARMLAMRAANLGVLDWSVWDPEHPSLVEELRHPTHRCTVVDLGSLDRMSEQRLVSEAVLSTLWGTRTDRRPCLVVVDEAHNICPAEPRDALGRMATDQAVQIAAEGRKYGLYLLTATQRPDKVHENVVSQCDNLLLMRMNSEADVADLARLFSFVPRGLLAGSTSFRLGEALVAGKLSPYAAYVQMGTRVSPEGGADVPTTWAAPRPRPGA